MHGGVEGGQDELVCVPVLEADTDMMGCEPLWIAGLAVPEVADVEREYGGRF